MSILKTSLFCLSLCCMMSCKKKPEACIDMPQVVEAGGLIKMKSCSEDADFEVWSFGDGSGNVASEPDYMYESENQYTLTLTAYSDGGYRSDEVSKDIWTSFRYMDRIEIYGQTESSFLEVFVDNDRKTYNLDDELIPANDPLIWQFWPNDTLIFEDKVNTKFRIVGSGGFGQNTLINGQAEVKRATVNPIRFENINGLVMNVFWRLKTPEEVEAGL